MIVDTDLRIPEKKISADNIDNSLDGQLIAQARSDPAAFAQLYRRHYDAVFRYCVHRLFERQTAQDVTSTIFLKVVKNFGRFRGSERDFRNWLYKIATNAVNKHLRQTAHREKLLKAAGEQAGSQSADCKGTTDELTDKMALLKQAILTLKPRYQTIITLRFFENLKLTEIAEMLDSSDGTVRSQLARALAKLRKKLNAAETAQPSGDMKNER
ncbi:MAG: RNA polymerase sigma factor [Planctomycetota bacterium]|jgi:RNA polymerase sigma-70 factor (ECF subfamily)